jgi:SAM-dependent methyltransferase
LTEEGNVITTAQHWNAVYAAKSDREVSWYQADPRLSLRLITEVCPDRSAHIIDAGGGTSRLVDQLLQAGFEHLAVLDISATALAQTQARLGDRAESVEWIVADVAAVDDLGQFDVWHDRATFHFLTDPGARQRYVELLTRTVPTGGHAIIATFAPDGPPTCSGLNVRRYDARTLADELGPAFTRELEVEDLHETPWGSTQAFMFARLRRV